MRTAAIILLICTYKSKLLYKKKIDSLYRIQAGKNIYDGKKKKENNCYFNYNLSTLD